MSIRQFAGKKHHVWRYIRMHPWLYAMLIPGLLCMVVFHFLPYYGIQIAFRDYKLFAAETPLKAIAASKEDGEYLDDTNAKLISFIPAEVPEPADSLAQAPLDSLTND